MEQLVCNACGFRWYPRVEKPTACPDCKSRKWATKPRPEKED